MVESDANAMDMPKPNAKLAKSKPVRPRPVAKKFQHQAKVPDVADQRDLFNKGSSTQKSGCIREFLFFIYELAWNYRSQH